MPDLAEYARVPMRSPCGGVLDVAVQDGGLGGFVVPERDVMLGAIRRFAYPGLPDEVQLLWYRDRAG